MKNLIYYSISGNPNYINMFKISFYSFLKYNSLNDYDILIITNSEFQKHLKNINSKLLFFIEENNSHFTASANKLLIDLYPHINNYEKILYVDTDVLFLKSLSPIFELEPEANIYVSNESENILLGDEHWGKGLFEDGYVDSLKDKRSMNAGLFYFGTQALSTFKDIRNFILKTKIYFECLEQPYFNYILAKKNNYKFELQPFISHKGYDGEYTDDTIILHFPGGPGDAKRKIITMVKFSKQ